MRPLVAGQVASEAGAGLVSEIGRTPKPKRGKAFIVSGEQITAVRTKSSGTKITRIGKLPQASAGDSVPQGETSVSNGSEGGERGIGNDYVNVVASSEGETSLTGRYFPCLQIFALRSEQDCAG